MENFQLVSKSGRDGLEVEQWLSFNTWAALCFGGSNPAWEDNTRYKLCSMIYMVPTLTDVCYDAT